MIAQARVRLVAAPNIIPFIDVLLVVLIFLMTSTTYSRMTALKVTLPSADDRRVLDQGFKRLGVRRGLSEAAWKPWLKAVQQLRQASDKRRAAVRQAAGLPPFRGSRERAGGGRAPKADPAIAGASDVV